MRDHRPSDTSDLAALWTEALASQDSVAAAALERLVMVFGAVAGDLALAHGSSAVVITGNLASRITVRLRSPLFPDRFVTKGRYRERMDRIQIKIATCGEAGLLGAALAFERDHLG